MKSVTPGKRIKAYRAGVPKLMNLRRTYFLNGPHPEIAGFIYFNENPLQMMNVPYYIWKALFIIEKQLNKKAKVNFEVNL